MTHVFHRHLRVTPPAAVAGRGVFVTDASGKQYLDASGGAAVSCLGHGHPDVLAAMHAQIDRIAYAHTSFFTTEVAEDARRPADPHGAGGNEPRLFRERRLRGRRGGAQDGAPVFRRDRSAGAQRVRRAGARATTATRSARSPSAATSGAVAQFAPLLIDVKHVAPCYAYRDQRAGETAEAYGARLAAELDATIRACGERRVHRLRRRDGRRRHGRRADARARLLQGACARSATATACC